MKKSGLSTVILSSLSNYNLKTLNVLLGDKNCKPGEKEKIHKRTALHFAVLMNAEKIVERLCELSASGKLDIDAQDEFEFTAFDYSLKYERG